MSLTDCANFKVYFLAIGSEVWTRNLDPSTDLSPSANGTSAETHPILFSLLHASRSSYHGFRRTHSRHAPYWIRPIHLIPSTHHLLTSNEYTHQTHQSKPSLLHPCPSYDHTPPPFKYLSTQSNQNSSAPRNFLRFTVDCHSF